MYVQIILHGLKKGGVLLYERMGFFEEGEEFRVCWSEEDGNNW
jgi:hypothetical protein